ncbi:MAG: GGDEF domain-containing protein [Comamonadaceae bacterium]|nr:GGDEF domain-containing protein [Burkholderiales bacterium]MEB2348106.1 GGDEF domain-containing protein [Comamonadaceae bacterium]
MIDLDHFKAVNDEFGHPVGDRVLCAVSEHMKCSLRRTDVLARLGGEEFAVLLPHTAADAAYLLAEKLRQSLAALRVEGLPRPVTCSVGVASTTSRWCPASDVLLSSADRAFYEAKNSGRHRTVIHALPVSGVAPLPEASSSHSACRLRRRD